MTEGRRIIKRLAIIAVYLSTAALVVLGFYFLLREEPTCSDGKRNQGEEKIDCGGPCAKCEKIPKIENILIVQKALIPAGPGKYDALVKIKNPNALFGVAQFDYTFDFFDGSGNIAAQESGSAFILPAETKYIPAFNVAYAQKPKNFAFSVKSFRWQKFAEFEEPDISVSGKELNLSGDGGVFSRLKAKIQNRSGYDFKKVTTKVVLKNAEGAPVAVNQTESNDVRVNEEREVIFNWNTAIPNDIDPKNIEIETEVDIFGNDNFMKKYGSPEQYQSYGISDKE